MDIPEHMDYSLCSAGSAKHFLPTWLNPNEALGCLCTVLVSLQIGRIHYPRVSTVHSHGSSSDSSAGSGQ